jgi:uncharacterized membrane protein
MGPDEVKSSESQSGVPDLLEMASEYGFWWTIQKITLLMCIFLLVLGIIVSWVFVVFSFLFLGFNLFANFKRVRLLRKLESSGLKFNPNLGR